VEQCLRIEFSICSLLVSMYIQISWIHIANFDLR
jgi:hypothetical protein